MCEDTDKTRDLHNDVVHCKNDEEMRMSKAPWWTLPAAPWEQVDADMRIIGTLAEAMSKGDPEDAIRNTILSFTGRIYKHVPGKAELYSYVERLERIRDVGFKDGQVLVFWDVMVVPRMPVEHVKFTFSKESSGPTEDG